MVIKNKIDLNFKKVLTNIKNNMDTKCDWWVAHHGNIEFITATQEEVEEIGADEWGSLNSFIDRRQKKKKFKLKKNKN